MFSRIKVLHALVLLLLTILLSGGCSSVYKPYSVVNRVPQKTYSREDTALSQKFATVSADRPGLSGAHVLDKGESSLLWRGVLAEQAEKSIDIQTFIWKDDNVGTIGAARLLEAAERGVKIRVLLDYLTLDVNTDYLVWLNDHPNINIRLYNPYPGLDTPLQLGKVAGLASSFLRFNRRMHNKLYMVDGAVVLIGGRNNADEYFDMHHEMNFRDRDLLVVGAIIPEAHRGFDYYWNSEWAIDFHQIMSKKVDLTERGQYYQMLKSYAEDPQNFPPRFNEALQKTRESLEALPENLLWGKAEIIYDIPGKNEKLLSLKGYGNTGDFLTQCLLKAEEAVLVETPYMVTMPGTLELFSTLRDRGIPIHILTDSLASAESDVVFSGYHYQRKDILESGVTLFELRPDAGLRKTVFQRFSLLSEMPLISLHAKTAVIDRRILLIGSFNLDPRSTHINTEYVFWMDSPELAEQVATIIEEDMDLENCWQVTETDGKMKWKTSRDGVEEISESEPDVSSWERVRLELLRILPIDSLPVMASTSFKIFSDSIFQ